MGWASGEEIFWDVWRVVATEIKPERRKEVAEALIDIFENHDADTIFDGVSPEDGVIGEIYAERYPQEEE